MRVRLVTTAMAALTVAAGCASNGATSPSTAPAAPTTPVATTTAAATTTTTNATTTTRTATTPAASITDLPADVRALMTGRSWRPGCPVDLDDLRLLDVPFVDLAGADRRGRLVAHEDVAQGLAKVFDQLHAQRFPIERIELVDDFAASDDSSMAANNTSAFNCRLVDGTTRWSEHSYGRAVDVNPRFNPWVRGTRVDPPNGAAYIDRTNVRPGMILADDDVVQTFAAAGWAWGGDQRNAKDYQHFSTTGR